MATVRSALNGFLTLRPNQALFRWHLDELPLAPESVDVIVMVHVLEFIAKPPVLLREVYQALAPGGQLIIVSLNPWSLWGIDERVRHFWPAWQSQALAA